MGKTKQILLYFLGISAFSTVAWLFISLARYITPAGSLVLLSILIWILLSKATHTIVFPGASWFYKKDVEYRFCYELIQTALTDLNVINSAFSEHFLNISKPPNDYSESFNNLLKIKETLERLNRDEDINKSQKTLLQKLIELKSSIKTFKGLSEIISQEDDSLHEQIKKICEETSRFLSWYCKSYKVFPYFSSKPLGDLNYMRADMYSKATCEQKWVLTDDDISIDW